MTTVLLFVAVALALTAGWALIQLAEASSGPPSPAGGDLMVLEHSPVGALLLDPGLRITWVNDTFCRFFGLTRAEVVGKKMPDLIQTHLKAAVAEPAAFESGLLIAYAPGGTATALEIHVIQQGTRQHRWLEHLSHVIRQGPLEGSRVEYFVNVTPLKHAALHQQAEGRRRGELNQALVDLSRKRTLAKGNRSTALREVSKIAASTLGVAHAELWLLSEDRDRWILDHYFDLAARRHKTTVHEVKASTVQDYFGVIEEVRVLAVADAKNDPRSKGLVGQSLLEPEAGARLDIPVRVRGKVVGAVVLAHHGARSWTSEEEQFAASVGDRLSLILEATEDRKEVAPPVPLPGPSLSPDPLDGFVHLDENLCFTYLNPTVLQWLEERGHDGGALVGKGLVESLRNTGDASIVAEIRKAARGGGPARLRRQFEQDGPWLDVYINPVDNGVSVTLQNKSRRYEKEAERSLQESETRFRSVVEALAEGLIITDLQDRVIYVNPRISELTGHRPEDLGGRNAQELLFDTKSWKDAEVRLLARKDRTRLQYEAPLLHKDGHTIGVEVISTPLRNAAGEVTGVVDAVTDLSSRPAREHGN
jgi:PAS domain S-box-containing protein